jgi:hypothetical protein
MIFELLRRRRLRQRVVSCLLIAVANAALLCRLQRDVAQYRVIDNVGIAVEFGPDVRSWHISELPEGSDDVCSWG